MSWFCVTCIIVSLFVSIRLVLYLALWVACLIVFVVVLLAFHHADFTTKAWATVAMLSAFGGFLCWVYKQPTAVKEHG